jgi:hypothetical protein
MLIALSVLAKLQMQKRGFQVLQSGNLRYLLAKVST